MVKRDRIKTEAGSIPEDWSVVKVEDIADVKTGPFGSALHADDYVLEGTPIITVEHLGEEGITQQNLPLVSDADKKRLSAYILRQGDIAFSRVGSVDRNAYITENEDGWLFSGRILRLRVKVSDVDPQYLGYHFKHEETKKRIRNVAVGQTMASLNTKIMNTFFVSLPSDKREQEAISQALSDVDRLIKELRELIDKKTNILIGLRQALLSGSIRLLPNAKTWEYVKMSDVCTITAKMVDPSLEEYSYLPHIGNESIEKNTGRLSSFNLVKDDSLISGKYYFVETDVLYGKINPQFRKVAFPQFCGLCSADMYPISCGNRIRPAFLKHLLLTDSFFKHTVAQSMRSGIPKVNRDEIMTFEFELPSDDEQALIVQTLEDMDLEVTTLYADLLKYQMIKLGMMDELLTGKIRLV